MKRQIIILLAVLLMLVPLAVHHLTAQETPPWPGAYPEELWGDFFGGEDAISAWVTPELMRYYPWSMPEFPDPPSSGYDGEFYFYGVRWMPKDSSRKGEAHFIDVELGPLVNSTRRAEAPPPAGYDPKQFEWSENAGCYMEEWIDDKGRLRFEAWVFRKEGKSQWITGCLQSTGSIGPWLEFSDACIYTEYDIEPFPGGEARRAGRRKSAGQ